MERRKVKIGLIQMNCLDSVEDNYMKAAERCGKLAKRGAEIIALPELFDGRYFCQTRNKKFFDLAQEIPGNLYRKLSALAKELKIFLVAGSIYEKTKGDNYYNTAVVFDPDGRALSKYRKVHIPDDLKNHYDENFYFEKGDLGFKVAKTKYGKIAVMICYDQWFPEGARDVAKQGAEIIFYPTAIGWPVKQRAVLNAAEHEAWQVIQRSHAIANNVFVAAINRVGKEDYLNFWGSSFVCDPYGRVLAMASPDREEDLLVECDLSLISQARCDWPFLKQCSS